MILVKWSDYDPLLFKSGQNGFSVKKYEHCFEIYEKTIFRFLRFLFFKMWSKFLESYEKWQNYFCLRKCAMFWNEWTSIFTVVQFLVCEFWSILYSKFVVNWGIRRLYIAKQNYVKGAPPPPLPQTPRFLGGSTSRTRILLGWIPLANWLFL